MIEWVWQLEMVSLREAVLVSDRSALQLRRRAESVGIEGPHTEEANDEPARKKRARCEERLLRQQDCASPQLSNDW